MAIECLKIKNNTKILKMCLMTHFSGFPAVSLEALGSVDIPWGPRRGQKEAECSILTRYFVFSILGFFF